ncbi:hypothetical protein ABD76_07625 [Paenibacillus dendritiformis]|uniref:hypothetical protein n=1 Tax=Paenibacillus dendritiformis TaxID=130049 RepID=UPI0018CEB101|nr:hypothetical protein [Paenibacillus dendritiformis]MBG9792371.1 hypothetical protein [Paenibacillus dendritiformis]
MDSIVPDFSGAIYLYMGRFNQSVLKTGFLKSHYKGPWQRQTKNGFLAATPGYKNNFVINGGVSTHESQ